MRCYRVSGWKLSLVSLSVCAALFGGFWLAASGCGGGGGSQRQPVILAKATPALGRVIVVGFDGLDPIMVRKFAAKGKLPNLTRMMDQGAFGTLLSTLPPSSASAWTSAVTGVNPGKHGIYGFMGQTKPDDTGQIVFNTSLQRGFHAVWKVLGDHGRRSVVINVPLTSPADSLNGLMVAGFPHSSDDSSAYYWPKSLQQDLSDYGFDAFRVVCAKNREDRFIQKMEGIESKRLEVGLRLFDRAGWDLYWIVFTFTDRYQHYLWKYSDPGHPMYDPIGGREHGGAIEDCYVMADRYLAEFMARMKNDDLLIVMSDHGFGRLDYTVNGQNFIYRTLGSMQDVACADFFGAKFKIEVSGHNAEERYTSVRNRLIEGLRMLKDPARGVPIIDSIYVKEEIYEGPYLSKAPDVVCMEHNDYLFFNLPRTSDMRIIDAGPSPDKAFSGFHRRPGTVGLFGSRVVPGTVLKSRITDIAPIIMAYLGVPAPGDIDGHVPGEAFKADPAAVLNLARSGEAGYRNPSVATSKGSKDMESQLRAIGYMQ